MMSPQEIDDYAIMCRPPAVGGGYGLSEADYTRLDMDSHSTDWACIRFFAACPGPV
jgi:hypothetical protein